MKFKGRRTCALSETIRGSVSGAHGIAKIGRIQPWLNVKEKRVISTTGRSSDNGQLLRSPFGGCLGTCGGKTPGTRFFSMANTYRTCTPVFVHRTDRARLFLNGQPDFVGRGQGGEVRAIIRRRTSFDFDGRVNR